MSVTQAAREAAAPKRARTQRLTPEALGFSMAAEWEPHAATWLAWPHNKSDWPGKLAPIPWVYGEMIRKIGAGETVKLLIPSRKHEASVRRILKKVGVPQSHVQPIVMPTDRGWTRDMGPAFVRRESPSPETALVRFRFNGWAKYPDWRLDDDVPEQVARREGLRVFRAQVERRDVVLEGGSIDVNGRGTLLTTEECLLDPVVQIRNPGFGRAEWEQAFREYLGARNVLWLGKGIAGDDTHGHVDDLCRFVDRRTVVLCAEGDPHDDNYTPLHENRERLAGMRLEDGSKIEVVALPMPRALYFEGRRLPASYANFYICNAAVLVPTFNDENDRRALGILSELIRDRPVVGIHAIDLVWGLGTIHCLTREEPAAQGAANPTED
jgi:agmatine deiminase